MLHVTLPSRTSNCIKLCAYWGSDYKGTAWWCSAYTVASQQEGPAG